MYTRDAVALQTRSLQLFLPRSIQHPAESGWTLEHVCLAKRESPFSSS